MNFLFFHPFINRTCPLPGIQCAALRDRETDSHSPTCVCFSFFFLFQFIFIFIFFVPLNSRLPADNRRGPFIWAFCMPESGVIRDKPSLLPALNVSVKIFSRSPRAVYIRRDLSFRDTRIVRGDILPLHSAVQGARR